ncbi:hypothetical protein CCMSSC00406_0003445 [Pleurotus cornucopiae]|uniref:Uncharacterized protein n=1 Tax=Pleurotus cornucopiae TaxID=5321 RepID=A0ACB7J8G8_PLECO|nr:hypothetical protein CCMSSC00406_0003445 [Pleurotus cornucopiae]
MCTAQVLVDNKKYACETCIKGHRSSSCQHTDRPLFEIKRKGRPVTQCEHCRELRKTKQVHVKCICEKDDILSDTPSPPSTSPPVSAPLPRKKGKTKVPDSAAFPHGLPEEALEATVAPHSSSESVSSDSDHGGSCSCKTGGECHCCTPRKSAPRKPGPSKHHGPAAASTSRVKERPAARHTTANPSTHMQSQIMARIAELRPVLPKPSPHEHHATVADAGPVHHPSSGIPHASRHHGHAYSPYNRTYEGLHSNMGSDPYSVAQNNLGTLSDPQLPETFGSQLTSQALQFATGWTDTFAQNVDNDAPSFPSACGCGDNCLCPGCLEHNPSPHRAPSPSAFAHCTNPGACSSCLDCTILSLPASIPPQASPIPPLDPYQSQALDEWFRRVSGIALSTSETQNFARLPQRDPQQSQQISLPPNIHSGGGTISPLQQMPDLSESFVNAMRCFGETCNCPPGMCQCIQCDAYPADTPDLTFATSGVRGSLQYQQSTAVGSYDTSSARNVASSTQQIPGRHPRPSARQGTTSQLSRTTAAGQMSTLDVVAADNARRAWTFNEPSAVSSGSSASYARSHSGSSSSLEDTFSSDTPFRDTFR